MNNYDIILLIYNFDNFNNVQFLYDNKVRNFPQHFFCKRNVRKIDTFFGTLACQI